MLARGDELLDARNLVPQSGRGPCEGERDAALHVDARVVVVALLGNADAESHEDDLGVDLALRRAAVRPPVGLHGCGRAARDLQHAARGDASSGGDGEGLKK